MQERASPKEIRPGAKHLGSGIECQFRKCSFLLALLGIILVSARIVGWCGGIIFVRC